MDTHNVMVEVSGCLTTCMHCWAVGGSYGAMDVADVAFLLDELARFSDERGYQITAYPMHEVTSHPYAPEVIRLFGPHLGGSYDPILTPGSPLASRADWSEVIAAAKEWGAKSLWLAFHGFGEDHDRLLMRPGAFEESLLAVRRAQESGLGTGANVFVTRSSLPRFERLLDLLERLGLGNLCVAAAGYNPTARGRRYEVDRPELDDLLPLVGRVGRLKGHNGEWNELASMTESAWVRKVLEDEPPALPRSLVPANQLVCRPNLDLFTGTHGAYKKRHGNLRRDRAAEVLERAFAAEPATDESLYFGDAGPATAELAARHGAHGGAKVYWDLSELRYRWRDQAEGRLTLAT